ncbi:MAG: hypothetical protein HY691_16930 [Chloroflexi bacterium]|nr:hypothetical protein [Chloroflexota bacterium]
MDGVTLLVQARAAGLDVHADGDRLVVRGPKSAEPLARQLLAAKVEIMPLLAAAAAERAAEGNYRADPRPELPDHAAWTLLLARAYALDGHDPGGVYGALHGMRCLGARLADDGHGWRLLPGELASAEYGEMRERWLLPQRDALTRLLGEVGGEGGAP